MGRWPTMYDSGDHLSAEALPDGKLKMRNLKLTVKIKNIWNLYTGISDFKKGYQTRTNIVKQGSSTFQIVRATKLYITYMYT
jgi:hypothetical protein